ncbi:MAG: hypothetical protein JXB85_04075 [Anaerolineales bacterium]|nr:hypothetical protein [Anaerolineales bacterium]
MDDEDPLILFLYNVESGVAHGEATDLVALQETAGVAMQLTEALRSRGAQVFPIPVQDSLDTLRTALQPFSPETAFIFNYCDGFGGNNMAATRIVRLIETLGFKHTGSTAEVIATCIDKSRAKRKLIAAGVATPRYQVFSRPDDIYRFDFPAFVKPLTDDASIGINAESVVRTPEALARRVEYLLDHYRQRALVEEYIHGRELAVSLWGNDPVQALPITEMDYSRIRDPLRHILTYDAKWNPASRDYRNTPTRCPAIMTRTDELCVIDAAVRTYQTLGLRDFARVDIRYHKGIPYIIDINEIPDLSMDSGFPNSARTAGYSYSEMAARILTFALLREGWLCPQPLYLRSTSPRLQTVNLSSP